MSIKEKLVEFCQIYSQSIKNSNNNKTLSPALKNLLETTPELLKALFGHSKNPFLLQILADEFSEDTVLYVINLMSKHDIEFNRQLPIGYKVIDHQIKLQHTADGVEALMINTTPKYNENDLYFNTPFTLCVKRGFYTAAQELLTHQDTDALNVKIKSWDQGNMMQWLTPVQVCLIFYHNETFSQQCVLRQLVAKMLIKGANPDMSCLPDSLELYEHIDKFPTTESSQPAKYFFYLDIEHVYRDQKLMSAKYYDTEDVADFRTLYNHPLLLIKSNCGGPTDMMIHQVKKYTVITDLIEDHQCFWRNVETTSTLRTSNADNPFIQQSMTDYKEFFINLIRNTEHHKPNESDFDSFEEKFGEIYNSLLDIDYATQPHDSLAVAGLAGALPDLQ